MHVVFRESQGLDDTETPFDLGQSPADLVVLSFSDSDLGAFQAGYRRGKDDLPSVRLANLVALKHPLSVDTYIEQTLTHAKGILIRLIGGESYWSYGLMSVQDLCRRQGIALAVLPADGRPDPALDALSTVPVSTLRRLSALCEAGGAVAAHAALAQMALAAGLYAAPVIGTKSVPDFGWYHPDTGVVPNPPEARPLVVVTFYRSYLTSADTEPVDALIRALEARGFAAIGLFAASLKQPAAADWTRTELARLSPAAIVNATAFSAQGTDGTSPLDAPGCPVFQVALSTARRKEWLDAERGLSPADLAMHVVLPEVDGRLFAGVASFKAPAAKDPDLEFSHFGHRADAERIDHVLERVAAWHALGQKSLQDKTLAVVLSTYPGRDWNLAHAVGLDPLASTTELAGWLGRDVPGDLGNRLTHKTMTWPLASYRSALKRLPDEAQSALEAAWGDPSNDPDIRDGAVHFAGVETDKTLIALQPERGEVAERDDDYHDLARTPRHAYVAFYLWLRERGIDALIHVGAHGTLEWLPGKSVALSDTCWPELLSGTTPVIYPFIVNDPGEAAQAKRRIGAVTLGHVPPPMTGSAVPEVLQRLEGLLDEYSTADGLDPARRDRLIQNIRDEAQATGVERDLDLSTDASAAEAVTRIDRFVCDIKESQFGDGLHVLGTGPHGAAEREGLLSALMGRRVPAGPSGSPYRGREDVLPTGRNLYTTDPRSVPTRAAHAQGVKMAEELVRRHLQDNGDWPRNVVVDLWGSATMRTAGEEFAMALHLAGLAPDWDDKSGRVTGFEVLPLALLGRPRIDVTLRVSGLFRDVFPGLAQLFERAAATLQERDEAADQNPYRDATPRVFGPRPGQYGLAMHGMLDTLTDAARQRAGEAWLAASSHAIAASGEITEARDAVEARVRGADAFVHVQDLPETDLLLASDYATHEAGFAAAVKALGGEAPALYHMDATRPDRPAARALPEEIARVVRARATHPDWLAGMMRHGFRGAAEIAATLDHMAAFAHLAGVVPAHLFDLYHDATLGDAQVADFLERENPGAFNAMRAQFQALLEAGLWETRRNSIRATLEGAA
ncbi:cobaltochelatase subunit CobN [Pseudaestuariivita atlantica]|uniref:Cobalamin biosynthesis protein CobN n=1 Tax=Pseudaestuariivita atlantica TaxID=1317121 RepID=A0A0L1JRL3_9RHOB|nr:cobaltochelatase subunit CobN [Pseudaestuariivita atlantica]KNG94023.1 cobalamin biosynthesis protein CobN [Pseudaestuariivita atlantica]